MIITYLRSSSFNTYDFCELKYFYEYALEKGSQTNKAATKGSIVHKFLEILAKKKLANQNGEKDIYDPEMDFHCQEDKLDLKKCFARCVEFYSETTNILFDEKDIEDCKKWIRIVLNDDTYNPAKRNIISPELHFDMNINEEWAKYSYEVSGQTISGNLRIKGTLDLVTDESCGTMEYTDWKTGKMYDWARGKDKTPESLKDDFQLRLYHYALAHLYPDYHTFILTLYYMKHGGPHPTLFHDCDLPKTKEIIKNRYLEIKNNYSPKVIRPHFKCRFCELSKNNYKSCKQLENEIEMFGIDNVTDAYLDLDKINRYVGGGKTI